LATHSCYSTVRSSIELPTALPEKDVLLWSNFFCSSKSSRIFLTNYSSLVVYHNNDNNIIIICLTTVPRTTISTTALLLLYQVLLLVSCSLLPPGTVLAVPGTLVPGTDEQSGTRLNLKIPINQLFKLSVNCYRSQLNQNDRSFKNIN